VRVTVIFVPNIQALLILGFLCRAGSGEAFLRPDPESFWYVGSRGGQPTGRREAAHASPQSGCPHPWFARAVVLN